MIPQKGKFRESGLRADAGEAILHPDTARAQGLRPGRDAWLETPRGRRRVRIRCDALALPAVIHVPVGPGDAALGWVGDRARSGGAEGLEEPLAICASDAQGVWRLQPARLRRA